MSAPTATPLITPSPILNGTDSVITSAKNTGIWTVDDDAKFFEIDEDGNVETALTQRHQGR